MASRPASPSDDTAKGPDQNGPDQNGPDQNGPVRSGPVRKADASVGAPRTVEMDGRPDETGGPLSFRWVVSYAALLGSGVAVVLLVRRLRRRTPPPARNVVAGAARRIGDLAHEMAESNLVESTVDAARSVVHKVS